MRDTEPNQRRAGIRLFVYAFASLYLELALIRFAGAEVIYLSYFSNFILISAFVGLGVGFLSQRHGEDGAGSHDLGAYLPFFFVLLFALVLVAPFDVSDLKDHFGLHFFGNIRGNAGLPGWVLLVLLFLCTVGIFAALGAEIAALFPRFRPLVAYTLDIGGSLAGIVVFSLQSLAWNGPVSWILAGTLLLVIAHLLGESPQTTRKAVHTFGAGVAALALLVSATAGEQSIWSPYQKLEWRGRKDLGVVEVYANSVLHQYVQTAYSVSLSYYARPYERVKETGGKLDEVLIIGAGSGTDVASALRAGAGHIDAVEIDPGIVHIGRIEHPDRPYRDPRVNLVITDGRDFLRNTRKQYDLIVFALPDSLLRLASMSNLRLESYLFTEEAFEDVARHLAPGGAVALYNTYRWEWLRERTAATLEKAVGRQPERFDQGAITVYMASERIGEPARAPSALPRLATDDWPYVYMQAPAIHWLYLAMIGLFLLAALGGVALFGPRGTLRTPAWPYFFMGAAFLLLETKSISLFSLLFGTTWLVNSMAFAGVLCSVLCANLVVHHFELRRRELLFGLLLVAFVVAWAVPSGALLGIESGALRFGASVGLVFAPIFLANLVFSRHFREESEGARAFGWNMLGAVAGGGLEYLSLLIGQRNLLFVAAACYLAVAAFVLKRPR